METILLVDDEPGVLTAQRKLLKLNGFSEIKEANSTAAARTILAERQIDLILLDLTLPDESGQELLGEVRNNYPATAVIVVTGASDVTIAVNCMRMGAYDFLVKGSDSGRIPAAVRNALDHRRTLRENRLLREAFTRHAPQHPEAFQDFISTSDAVSRILVYLEALASLPDPLLITGETGVGKELVARGVHRASGRTGNFVPVNLGGLDDHVFSDTIFGHKRGAFTGADTARDGLVATAAEGTLFFDEIGEMPAESQARLLRFLDTGEFMRLGSDRPEYSRARIVCATNRNLEAEVETGRFRRDLYFRIATHTVRIPPLRERPADIPLIMRHLMDVNATRIGRPMVPIPDAVVATMEGLPLPGNVRELQHVVLRALIEGHWPGEIPNDVGIKSDSPAVATSETMSQTETVRFGPELPTPDQVLELLLREADRRHPESRTAAAGSIGLSPQAFANRWKRMLESSQEAE